MPVHPDSAVRFYNLSAIPESGTRWAFAINRQIEKFMALYRTGAIETQDNISQRIFLPEGDMEEGVMVNASHVMTIPMTHSDFFNMVPVMKKQLSDSRGAVMLQSYFGVKLEGVEDTVAILGSVMASSPAKATDHIKTRQDKLPLTQYRFTIGTVSSIRVNTTFGNDHAVSANHIALDNGLRGALAGLFLWDEGVFEQINQSGMFLATRSAVSEQAILKSLLVPRAVAQEAQFGSTQNLGLYFARPDDEILPDLGRSAQMARAFEIMAKSENHPVGVLLTG